jgi:flagellar biosynthetic protein FliR
MSGVLVPEEMLTLARQLGLGAARTVPIAWMIPAFGGASLPRRVRIAMGVGMAAFCWPVLRTQGTSGAGEVLLLMAVREVLVGLVMGFVCSCFFRAAEAAGGLVDVLRGSTATPLSSPFGAGGSSPIGLLMLLTATIVFFEIGGLEVVVLGIVRSYEAIPLGPFRPPSTWPGGAMTIVIMASARLIEASVALSSPVIVTMLIADLLLGLLGRIVPGVAIHSFGGVTKTILAVVVLLAVFLWIRVVLERGWTGWLRLFVTTGQMGW